MDKYIGMDVHARSCTLAVVDGGKRVGQHVVETNGESLIECLRMIPGQWHLCIEEGTQSGWLYEILSPHVQELAVVNVTDSRGPQGHPSSERKVGLLLGGRIAVDLHDDASPRRLRCKHFDRGCSGRGGDIHRRMQTKPFTLAVGLALIAGACGAPETDPQATEVRQEPLRAFGNWTQMASGLSYRAPVIITSDSAGTMMAVNGLDDEVYTTSTQDPGGIGAAWRQVSWFGPTGGAPFSNVAGAGLLGETGAMANAVVLADNRIDGKIYIRVQNQTGTVVFHDWDPIPAQLPLLGASMTWLPRFSLSGSQRMLILVAHAPFNSSSPDGFVYVAGNTLTGGVYNHANWSSFNRMTLPGGGALPFSDPSPRDSFGTAYNYTPLWLAAAWACPPSSNDYSLVVAASQYENPFDQYNHNEVVYFTKYNALGGGWTPWTQTDRLFLAGSFGLAAGCGEFTHEMTIAGISSDGRAYADAKQISGRPPSWSAIGTQTFGPQLQGGAEIAHVSAGYSAGLAWVTAVNVLSLDYATAPTP